METLGEWTPLIDLVNSIPETIQKGILFQDVNITCVDCIPEFIALGTNLGIVFWFNRKSGIIDKLITEPASPITCVKIISSVEYMVAVGSSSGVNIFQIQKAHPPDVFLELLIKNKPTERYVVKDLHNSNITCFEWSKNGMKLFSGDKTGIVVLTEINYQTHVCESREILNEKYEIIQMKLYQSNLLISTIYRSVICLPGVPAGKYKVTQIGKKDRKAFSDLGAIFFKYENEIKVISSRSGFRLWISDFSGNVEQTLVFKDAIKAQTLDIPVLNPTKLPIRVPTSFGRLYPFLDKYVISVGDNMLFVLNLQDVKMEGILTKLRKIMDISVSKNEILILESPRSLIRLSTVPEYAQNTILYKNIDLFTPTDNQIVVAEECIECSNSKADSSSHTSHLVDHLKKLELFEAMNELKYDESILFKTAKKRKEKNAVYQIVEIGQIPKSEAN